MIALTRAPIDTESLQTAVRDPLCGAVVLFLGTVRELTGDTRTEHLVYEGYEPMAEAKLNEVAAVAKQQWPLRGVGIIHRLGRIEIGEVAVAVAVSSPHRAEAFDAASFIMDRIKEIVPIWKEETAPDGASSRVHP